jgi:hypothetical protein
MKFQIERTNGTIEYVEADSFHLQEIGASSSLMGGKTGGSAHYVFRNDPKERYGMAINVAAYTDVLAVRLAPQVQPSVQKEPDGDAVLVESVN